MKLVLDLDTGVDDSLALTLALASPEVELVGVTAVFGNVARDTSARNSLAILHMLGRDDVPVYRGRDRARTADAAYAATHEVEVIHGANGIGNVEIPDAPREPEDQTAEEFIAQAIERWGKELVIVPTGPLTTIAAVLEADPSLAEKVGGITLMGGALAVGGNVSPCAEANIANDPEAAAVVFSSGAPITMIGLDVTLRTLLPLEATARWRAMGAAGRALADITDYYIHHEPAALDRGGCVQHDPLAVAAAIDPTLVRTFSIPVKVDCAGELRGRTIGDKENLLTGPCVKVALGVDAERFERMFEERVEKLLTSVAQR